ncbi:MAG: transposase, partial [Candidatus Marinimicrobia bacterium]|nr:transposase [Candidatus Neomarinimicrobiota bacterium]
MKIQTIHSKTIPDNKLVVAFDVGKDKLDAYCEYGQHCFQDTFANNTLKIEQKLITFSGIAESTGYDGLRIVAEPTGIYHLKLFRTARRLGHQTALVNPESVHKFKVVESNDSGKTDNKDPRVINLLAKYGKILIDRDIRDEYLLLRQLNTMVIDEEKAYTATRCKIHRVLAELFCDYSFKKDFLYTNTGRIFMEKYHANPYRIIQRGYPAFCQRMKKTASRIRKTTLQRLWQDAQCSVRHQLPADYVQVLESRLNYLWEELLLRENRKAEIEDAMISITDELRRKDPDIPTPVKGVVTAFRITQMLAETGPLNDFNSIDQLMRYAGLNIRERKSGYYRGNNKISKKGRSNLRRVLGYIVLPLVKKKSLYGSVYHAKKDSGMVGNKAMVAMMRKFLRMFYGWYKSGLPFDRSRVFNDQSN